MIKGKFINIGGDLVNRMYLKNTYNITRVEYDKGHAEYDLPSYWGFRVDILISEGNGFTERRRELNIWVRCKCKKTAQNKRSEILREINDHQKQT